GDAAMSADQPTPEEVQFTALFAAAEEALASGRIAEPVCSAPVPPELLARLQRDLECVQQLRQALGRSTTAAEPSPNLPGPRLGRFEVRRELGRGGFGIVYLAYDALLGREVALKVPRAEVAAAPELRERFQREARAAAALEHPNIVPVYEA